MSFGNLSHKDKWFLRSSDGIKSFLLKNVSEHFLSNFYIQFQRFFWSSKLPARYKSFPQVKSYRNTNQTCYNLLLFSLFPFCSQRLFPISRKLSRIGRYNLINLNFINSAKPSRFIVVDVSANWNLIHALSGVESVWLSGVESIALIKWS